MLTDTKHVLFLFDGVGDTAEGYKNLTDIATAVTERYGERIKPVAVVPHGKLPAGLSWDGLLVLDASHALHDRYGAGAECLYWIRPDGYVGFRAQPAHLEPLLAHLERVLVPAPRGNGTEGAG